MNPTERLLARIAFLEERLNKLEKSDRVFVARTLQMQDGENLQFGKTTGTKIATEATQKLSFFGETPIVQWSSGVARQDYSDGGGVASKVGTQWNGNTGAVYYSVGDVVAALKAYGLLDT